MGRWGARWAALLASHQIGGAGLAAASAALVGACLAYVQPPTSWLRRGVLHVSPNGFDGFVGHSRPFAVRTIQRAADLADPGETILIWPGTYREEVFLRRGGRPGRPLVLRAAIPGQAVISGGADPAIVASWRWQARGAHLWSTPVRAAVAGLRWDGVMAFRSGSLPHLRKICSRPGAWPAFTSSDGELWLCLPRGERPEPGRLEVVRPMPWRTRSGGHQVASLWIEAPHVEVRDLRFDFAVMAAIQLWNTHHVLLEGNHFEGADVAINGNPSLRPLQQIRVSRNLSSCYPLYEWNREGWLSWSEIYSYSNCSLAWLGGADMTLDRNVVMQSGDGIKLSPEGGHNEARSNLIVDTTDDAFEFDGPARNLLVTDNVVFHSLVAFAPSPVSEGPLMIEGNTVVMAPSHPRQGYGVLLKLMGGAIHHVTLKHNFFLGYQMAHGQADSPVTAVVVEANGFATVRAPEEGLAQAAQMSWRANRFRRLSLTEWAAASHNPASLASVGGRPAVLPPVGPAWMDLFRDRASLPLRPSLQSPWLRMP